jgi:hypothetical protein
MPSNCVTHDLACDCREELIDILTVAVTDVLLDSSDRGKLAALNLAVKRVLKQKAKQEKP